MILVYTVVHEIQSLRLVLVIGWSEKYLMATTNNHSADASQPSEFELRRAALVSEIGEVRLIQALYSCHVGGLEHCSKTSTDSRGITVVSGTSPRTCQCFESKSGRDHRGVSPSLP